MPPSDDRALVAGCRAGDQDAWRDLLARHRPRLIALAVLEYRLDAETAQDVVQESLLRAFSRLDQLRDPDALGAWLVQLTRRGCLDVLRRDRPADVLPEDLLDPRQRREDEQMVLRACLEQALAELPSDSREVVDRFFLRDESYATIGRELRLPPGTVASRIARALARLRVRLQE